MPFRGTLAVRRGTVTAHQLRRDFVRLHRDVYVRKGTTPTAIARARAAQLWAGDRGVLAGFSAAALHGSKWIDASEPAELIRAGHVRAPKGIVVRKAELLDGETCRIDGMAATTPARTAFDLGRGLGFDRAVEVLDALCNATGLDPAEVSAIAERHPGVRGLVRLRRVLDMVDGGAESPAETRTRLLIVRDGLPRPATQIRVRDESGRVIARSDLGWERWRVLVEYDGEHHWLDERQRSRDIDRAAVLEALGWAVVRVSAELLRDRPGVVLERVRAKLRVAGAPV
ncbi:hypothetical protein ABIC28_004629 [Rhodococcus sp. PvR044]|jgi:hypothetical protein|uniref:DUF559 domain-containing protein n=1 Tax=Rhodococcus TaxID=1827 RepID=UPI001AE1A07F|nr:MULTISPECIES: DUF559 domain-containing protein [Rhodococcus]MBP1159355.1 hypothetical protein [Rhodococcus sp. PvR099]MCZ4556822.1 DUF559 domain-containing protein [Rhodococcus maanshanensis]